MSIIKRTKLFDIKNMDFKNLAWVSEPNICRCCLSANGDLELTETYVNDAGIQEVFADILRECLGISLSLINSCASKRICNTCITDLRIASKFRKQVDEADKCFNYFWNNIKDIKNEPNIAKEIAENTVKREKISMSEEYDSDTPIANYKSLVKECRTIKNEMKEDYESKPKTSRNKVKNKTKGLSRLKNKKKVSERKRMILTCGTILKETTACPFRLHNSWFRCFYCTLDFIDINEVRKHTLQSHTDIDNELKKIKRYPLSLQIEISNLECHSCRLNLIDVESMKQHFSEKHNRVIYKECIADFIIKSSPFTCHLCKMEFHVFKTLTTHLNEHYANRICDECGKTFLNSKRLRLHKQTHENGMYPCTSCGKVFKNKSTRASHMESHRKRIVKCQICSKTVKDYAERIKHLSEVHNITHKFTCPVCSREYINKSNLAGHIRQTHGTKKRKCTECDMAFVTNYALKKHMIKHTGERPYSCNICSKSYAKSCTLRKHMSVHENDKRLIESESYANEMEHSM